MIIAAPRLRLVYVGVGLLILSGCGAKGPQGDGSPCSKASECVTGVCTGGTCAPASCTDRLENGTETDVDCGGSACPRCFEGRVCQVPSDCLSGQCLLGVCKAPGCTDGQVSGKETDVDCGGTECQACADGKRCTLAKDCTSGVCTQGVCQVPTCTDGLKNGAESDVDCGGPVCQPCGNGKACTGTTDCREHLCLVHLCVPSTCNDGVLNGLETDVDCGGLCPGCPPGRVCRDERDCADHVGCPSNVCTGCGTGFADCDADAGGCETNVTTSVTSCGGCNLGCSANHLTPSCVASSCMGTCEPGYLDCNADLRTDGCERSVSSDPLHCGGCDTVCEYAHAAASCASSTCAMGACAAGFADCDHAAATGCETNVTGDQNNCGACNHACATEYPNANSTCAGSACAFVACQPGFVDLDKDLSNGCEYACTATPGTDLPDDTFTDSNCDGIDGTVSQALFVTELGNDSNDGSMAAPMRTLNGAIAKAAGLGKTQILVSKGTYLGRVILGNGLSLYGGYDSTKGWKRAAPGVNNVTLLRSDAEAGGRISAVEGANLTQKTTLDGFTIIAGNASSPGGSSYGLICLNCTGLEVLGCDLSSGSGASGVPGSNGATAGVGTIGGSGGAGNCDANVAGGVGGSAGASACGRPGGAGGKGGDYGKHNGEAGGPGVPLTTGGGPFGNWGDPGGAGQPGSPGASGSVGVNGPGGSGGALVSGLWLSASGGAGVAGAHGIGGGGGGGGGAQHCTIACNDGPGNGGGGGGGAGCGGPAGTGGSGGGGSFALYLGNSTATVRRSTLRTQTGGAGGGGGLGATGGKGADGGKGAVLCIKEVGAGGDGASGGDGGDGGHGGGGAGGPSIGIYRANGSTVTLDSPTFLTASGGAGGSSPGNQGIPGASSDVF